MSDNSNPIITLTHDLHTTIKNDPDIGRQRAVFVHLLFKECHSLGIGLIKKV